MSNWRDRCKGYFAINDRLCFIERWLEVAVVILAVISLSKALSWVMPDAIVAAGPLGFGVWFWFRCFRSMTCKWIMTNIRIEIEKDDAARLEREEAEAQQAAD